MDRRFVDHPELRVICEPCLRSTEDTSQWTLQAPSEAEMEELRRIVRAIVDLERAVAVMEGVRRGDRR